MGRTIGAVGRLGRGGLALLFAVPFAVGCSQTLDETFDVEPGGRLVVDLDEGDVEVTSHDADTVTVRASVSGLNAPFYDLALEHDDDEVSLSGDLSWFRARLVDWLDVEVRIVVPRRYDVLVSTWDGRAGLADLSGSARIDVRHGEASARGIEGDLHAVVGHGGLAVERVQGRATLEARHGDVSVSDVDGPLSVGVRHGSARASDVAGPARIETRHGVIALDGVDGDVDAEVRHGEIQIARAAGAVRARTRHGGVAVEFVGAPGGEIETRHGAIDVTIPADAAVDLVAETERGRVDVASRLGVSARSGPRVDVAINGGGPLLRLKSRRADIDVRAGKPASEVARRVAAP